MAPSLASQLPQVSLVYMNVMNDADIVGAGLPAMGPSEATHVPQAKMISPTLAHLPHVS
ncbi:hypothetical protein EMIT0232MI5_10580 [Pseudomonas sp. IT-232MI5]